jgi:hypothetical protein
MGGGGGEELYRVPEENPGMPNQQEDNDINTTEIKIWNYEKTEVSTRSP